MFSKADQRGQTFTRIRGARVDAGATEYDGGSPLIVVDTNVDSVDATFGSLVEVLVNPGPDGRLSLREAVEAANHANGPNEIQFDPSFFAEVDGIPQAPILLSGEQLFVSDTLTIIGLGPDRILIDGQLRSRILAIGNSTDSVDFHFHGIHLTRGQTDDGGGAILKPSGGAITIEDSVFDLHYSAGSGGAIASDTNETTFVSNSVFEQNASGRHGGAIAGLSIHVGSSVFRQNTAQGVGGAIASSTSVHMADGSLVHANASTAMGGGVSADDLTIKESTISNNQAGDAGGGAWAIWVSADSSTISSNSTINDLSEGGGVYTGQFESINSTVSGNSVGGKGSAGGGVSAGHARLIHSTVVNNHADETDSTAGGIYTKSDSGASASLTAINSILDGNSSNDADSRNYRSAGDVRLEGSITNVFNSIDEMLLAPLADNGGPSPTHELLVGSPAIDAAIDDEASNLLGVPLSFDQRGEGFWRISGRRVDVGAYERQLQSLVVDSLADIDDGNFDAGRFSLREAIGITNRRENENRIEFDEILKNGTIRLNGSELRITDDLTIAGLGADSLSLDGDFASRVFNIDDGDDSRHSDVALSGISISSGKSAMGGAALNRENLELNDVRLTGNRAGEMGGAVFNGGAILIVESVVEANNATSGGGIFNSRGSKAEMVSSTIAANIATGGRGGVDNRGGDVRIDRSTVSGTTSTSGGGIHNSGSMEVLNSTNCGNTGLSGGGVFNASAAFIVQSTLAGNAALSGAGIFSIGDLTLANSIAANSTGGGGVESLGGLQLLTAR